MLANIGVKCCIVGIYDKSCVREDTAAIMCSILSYRRSTCTISAFRAERMYPYHDNDIPALTMRSLVIISTRACFALFQTPTTEVLSSPVADVDMEILLTTLGELLSGWTEGENYVVLHLTHVEDTRHLNLCQFFWVKFRHTFLQRTKKGLIDMCQ